MSEQIEKLVFDPTMSNPDNYIPNEQHAASSRVIVARYGGFFKTGLRVIQGGRTLTEGVDFKLAAYSSEASREVGQAIYYAIVILTNSNSPIIVNYHALGGVYTSYSGVIIDLFNELNLLDDVVKASDIVGLPEVFPPGPHKTSGDDLVGLSRVVEMLARITDAIETGNPATIAAMKDSLLGKVERKGPIRLNPTNGHATITSTYGVATNHDLLVPRAEATNTVVVVELMFVGDEGVSNATISYREVASGIADVVHNRVGQPTDSVAKFGVAHGNANKTVIRFFNDADTKPFKDVFVKSVSSASDEDVYGEVSWGSGSSTVPVTLRPFSYGLVGANSQPIEVTSRFIFARDSGAFDSGFNKLLNDEPASMQIAPSRYAFNFPSNLSPNEPVEASLVTPDFDGAVNQCKALATQYGSEGLVYENLGALYEALPSGREHPCLSYKADENRPILFIQIATHGNEKMSLLGFFEYIKTFMTSNDDDMVWARENMAIMAMCVMNPDGWALDRRRNGTDDSDVKVGINLNRNFDHFFRYASDPDKGPHAFSEVETRNLKNWMEQNGRIDRGVMFLDYHGWFSRTIYGFLTDHNYVHGMETQTLHRSVLNFTNRLLETRNFGSLPIVNGRDNITMSERASTRKPYAPYWAAQRFSRYKGYCAQIEWPQSESQAVNALVVMDTLHATTLAIRDHVTELQVGMVVDPAVRETDILNSNTMLDSWYSPAGRPSYYRHEGLAIADQSEGVDLFRPLTSAWPVSMEDAAAATYVNEEDESKSFIMVVGGSMTGGRTDRVYIEPLTPPPPPEVGSNMYGIYKAEVEIDRIADLPINVQNTQVVYHGGYFWVFFGYSDDVSGSYSNRIYRIPVMDDMNDAYWELVKESTVHPAGLQRHRAVVQNGWIYIVGGRNGDGYQRSITAFDPVTFNEFDIGIVPYKNGWFGLEPHPSDTSKLIYFGGWGGSSPKDDAFTITVDGAASSSFSRLADMPVSIRNFHHAIFEDKLYVVGGIDGDAKYSTDILEYNITTDTWKTLTVAEDASDSTYAYSTELSDEEEAFGVDDVAVGKGAFTYNPLKESLYIISGEREINGERVASSTFFEFNLSTTSLSARLVNDVSWGTFKPSSKKPLSGNLPVMVTAAIENKEEGNDDADLAINPYIRTLAYIGPLWSQTKRWRHKYMVPPRGRTITMPIYAPPSGNTGDNVYSYLRMYGQSTRVGLKSFQVIEGVNTTPRCFPETGMARERGFFAIYNEPHQIDGCFMLPIGVAFTGDITVARFKGAQSYEIRYSVTGNYNEGEFYLDILGDTPSSHLLGTWNLNFDLYANIFKRDVVHFRVSNRGTLTVRLWIYGKEMSIVVPEVFGAAVKTIDVNPAEDAKYGVVMNILPTTANPMLS